MSTSSNVIHPTHNCFDDAVEYLEQRVRAEPYLAHLTTLRVVHGIVKPDGKRFAHAWCEEHTRVIDSGVLDGQRVWITAEKAEWYGQIHVEAATSYTIRDVWELNKRFGHVGPWRDEYRALCR